MDHRSLRQPDGALHRQRIAIQVGRHPERNHPPDDPPAPRVQHPGEVQPARSGKYVRDVGYPQLVGDLGREVPVHQVQRGPGSGVIARLVAPARHASDVQFPHRPHHPLTPYPLALSRQRRVDPWPAMDPAARDPDRHNSALASPVAPRLRPGPTVQPIVVRAGGETQRPAYGRQRQPDPVRACSTAASPATLCAPRSSARRFVGPRPTPLACTRSGPSASVSAVRIVVIPFNLRPHTTPLRLSPYHCSNEKA